MGSARWTGLSLGLAGLMAGVLGFLVWAVPSGDGAQDGSEGAGFLADKLWFDPMIPGGWMAWTFPVALFFFVIACLLITFTLLAIRYPETPRTGVLRIETTRGDRLFITLLGSAFLNLAWLFFFGAPLTWALILCLVYAAAVFRWV